MKIYANACGLNAFCIYLHIRLFTAVFPTLLNFSSWNLANPFFFPYRKQRTNKINWGKCAYIDGFIKLGHIHWHQILMHSYVTVSGKTGLTAHSQVSRNGGFKYSKCCSLPMVTATRTKFSHVLQQSITFQILQWRSSQQLSFPPF